MFELSNRIDDFIVKQSERGLRQTPVIVHTKRGKVFPRQQWKKLDITQDMNYRVGKDLLEKFGSKEVTELKKLGRKNLIFISEQAKKEAARYRDLIGIHLIQDKRELADACRSIARQLDDLSGEAFTASIRTGVE